MRRTPAARSREQSARSAHVQRFESLAPPRPQNAYGVDDDVDAAQLSCQHVARCRSRIVQREVSSTGKAGERCRPPQITSWPAAAQARARCAPMKPLAPAISTRTDNTSGKRLSTVAAKYGRLRHDDSRTFRQALVSGAVASVLSAAALAICAARSRIADPRDRSTDRVNGFLGAGRRGSAAQACDIL